MKFQAFKFVFPRSFPILTGFWFVGIAYGAYMNVSGFSFVYPMLMSLIIFGGSLEFICVSMLLSTFAPLSAFLVALVVQARHLFYGISMLDKYRGLGLKRFYLIFGMCDETFSINYTSKIPEHLDKGWCFFFVTLLNHFYWVSGSALGGLLGNFITFDTTGLWFVMEALFVVIFIEQWINDKKHTNGVIGIAVTALCMMLLNKDSFLLAAMVIIFSILTMQYFYSKKIKGRLISNG
ncbi:MAG: AzlC family ABC transporter permease [Succinivibrio sp.]|nr:AzlC family ABC transporter permease [Succinivibrio sp.]